MNAASVINFCVSLGSGESVAYDYMPLVLVVRSI